MANSQSRFPFGDAFIFNTPHIDQLSNQLYQEQRQKEAYQEQQNKSLDDEFSRNLTGIRDADIGKLTQAYGDFKQANMNVIKNKNITPEQQLDVLRKKANVYDVINQSKSRKEWETGIGKQIMTDKKGLYADDAHQRLIQMMKTPYDQVNPDEDQKLLYQYSMPDLDKEIKNAQGKPIAVETPTVKSTIDPLKDEKKVYTVGNNPYQFASALGSSVVTSNKKRSFEGIYLNKYNDQELSDLTDKYNAKVNSPEFIEAYGKPQPLPATDTDFGKALAIRTMEEYANKNVTPKIVSTPNEARVTANRQAFQKQRQQASFAHAVEMQRVGFNHTDTKEANKQTENNQWIDNFIDANVDKAKNYPLIGDNRTVPLDPVSSKALAKGNTPAVGLQVSEDGKTFTPVYPKYDATGNATSEPNEALTQPMTRDQLKMDLGYKVLSKKDLGGAMSSGNKGSDNDVIKIKFNGKVLQGRKGDLKKLDDAKIKYEIIK